MKITSEKEVGMIIKQKIRRKNQLKSRLLLAGVSCFVAGVIIYFLFVCFAQIKNYIKIDNKVNILSTNKSKSSADLPLSNFKIVVDAGHGGNDPGSLGKLTNVYEENINLAIASLLEDKLNKLGATITMTRTKKDTVTFEQREKIIQSAKADFTISIHQNFNDASNKIHGTQILVRDKKYEEIAKNIQKYFNKIHNVELSYLLGSWKLLKYGNAPSFIVECGFLSNPSEEKKLTTKDYQNDIAQWITDWLVSYWSEERPS